MIDGWYMCFHWKLDYIYDVGYNTQFPIAAVRVFYDYYKYYYLRVEAYLRVSGRNYIYFRGGAAISYMGVSVGYSADIYTITLREQKVYLNSRARLEYPSRPLVFAAGFYGDYALARYKEVMRSPLCPFGCETGYTADVYMVRPIFQSDGTIRPFVDVDYTPSDEYGLSRFFITANRYWNYLTASDDFELKLNTIYIKNSVGGVDVFSVGIPWPFKTPIPIDTSLTVGIGQDQ